MDPTLRPCGYDVDCESSLPSNSTLVKCIQGLCNFESIASLNKTDKVKNANNPSLHMLPIMIIMGIMFVGMCVALNLFSRARFKNSRSIFSNPRILKIPTKNRKGKRKRRVAANNADKLGQLMVNEKQQADDKHQAALDEDDEKEEDDDKFVEISLHQSSSLEHVP